MSNPDTHDDDDCKIRIDINKYWNEERGDKNLFNEAALTLVKFTVVNLIVSYTLTQWFSTSLRWRHSIGGKNYGDTVQ